MIREINPQEAYEIWKKDKDQVLILDSRTPEEFTAELGHIDGALLIPHDLLPDRLQEVAPWKKKKVVAFCKGGTRSMIACEILQQAGFENLYNVTGGMMGWCEAGLPTVEAHPVSDSTD